MNNTGQPANPLVVLIDDERAMRESVAQWLDLADFRVQHHASGRQAIEGIDKGFDGIVVSDLRMPGFDGMDVLEAVVAVDPAIPVILISGHGDIASAVAAMQQGAYDFIEKPFQPERLLSTVRRAGEHLRLVRENRHLHRRLDRSDSLQERLMGDSAAMRQMRSHIADYATVDANVLLIGETGTGKEITARCLHDFGQRAGLPYRAIDCGSIAPDQVEQQLFGTAGPDGARSPFELADGGTILLDEIINMPSEQQVKLLRVIEEREVQPVGESDARTFDVRIISASSRELHDDREASGFRDELYFRLNTLELHLPPLRDREDDAVQLFQHFAEVASRSWERTQPQITSADVTALRSHPWPGNVRELRNVAERFVLIQQARVHDLLQCESGSLLRSTLTDQVMHFERSLIHFAMQRHAGNLAEVAEFLGTPRRTLSDKLQRHDIDRTDYAESSD